MNFESVPVSRGGFIVADVHFETAAEICVRNKYLFTFLVDVLSNYFSVLSVVPDGDG